MSLPLTHGCNWFWWRIHRHCFRIKFMMNTYSVYISRSVRVSMQPVKSHNLMILLTRKRTKPHIIQLYYPPKTVLWNRIQKYRFPVYLFCIPISSYSSYDDAKQSDTKRWKILDFNLLFAGIHLFSINVYLQIHVNEMIEK